MKKPHKKKIKNFENFVIEFFTNNIFEELKKEINNEIR